MVPINSDANSRRYRLRKEAYLLEYPSQQASLVVTSSENVGCWTSRSDVTQAFSDCLRNLVGISWKIELKRDRQWVYWYEPRWHAPVSSKFLIWPIRQKCFRYKSSGSSGVPDR